MSLKYWSKNGSNQGQLLDKNLRFTFSRNGFGGKKDTVQIPRKIVLIFFVVVHDLAQEYCTTCGTFWIYHQSLLCLHHTFDNGCGIVNSFLKPLAYSLPASLP
jgi:hypothetical protein